MTHEFIASPNFKPRTRRDITVIVIHYTASMSMDGTIAWFRNRKSQVSAHYVIGRDGRVVQMVDHVNIAWHAWPSEFKGRRGVNAFSLGIELVGTADSGFTVKQLNALYRLLEQLVVLYDIPETHVVGHADVSPGRKIDPDGYDHQFPWNACRWVVRQAHAKAAGTVRT